MQNLNYHALRHCIQQHKGVLGIYILLGSKVHLFLHLPWKKESYGSINKIPPFVLLYKIKEFWEYISLWGQMRISFCMYFDWKNSYGSINKLPSFILLCRINDFWEYIFLWGQRCISLYMCLDWKTHMAPPISFMYYPIIQNEGILGIYSFVVKE